MESQLIEKPSESEKCDPVTLAKETIEKLIEAKRKLEETMNCVFSRHDFAIYGKLISVKYSIDALIDTIAYDINLRYHPKIWIDDLYTEVRIVDKTPEE